MKRCVSTDVGTWTNWLPFQPDPDYSPDARTGLLSPISYALQRGILLRRENPTYRYWAPVAAATRHFKIVLFTASRGNNFVGGTCAPPSALRVLFIFCQSRFSNTYRCPKKRTGSILAVNLTNLHNFWHVNHPDNLYDWTKSLAIAERPRDASCHWIFC